MTSFSLSTFVCTLAINQLASKIIIVQTSCVIVSIRSMWLVQVVHWQGSRTYSQVLDFCYHILICSAVLYYVSHMIAFRVCPRLVSCPSSQCLKMDLHQYRKFVPSFTFPFYLSGMRSCTNKIHVLFNRLCSQTLHFYAPSLLVENTK